MPTGVYKHKPLSKEHKNSISKGLLGHFVSEETKKKLSLSKMGDKNPSYGKPPSEKQKKALNQKGKHFSEEHRRNIGKANKGKERSEGTREKMSEAKRGKYGENANNWRGGISFLEHLIRTNFKYRQWRSDVFTRDDFTCQKCGIRGGKLNAHHIKSFSSILQYYEITTLEEALECEELWNINNGITFCKNCHKKIGLHKGIKKNAKTNNKILK